MMRMTPWLCVVNDGTASLQWRHLAKKHLHDLKCSISFQCTSYLPTMMLEFVSVTISAVYSILLLFDSGG